ncbi:hypothetical protein QFZ35_001117 [Arthrobacter ulcerisalmonis]|uniref:hypothetical protein n=1 Tax=Arthrobacter sp. B1I2 TaxID=3042263 RepID=UPI00277D56EE|nr:MULTISPECIES: hypothetical protein [Arthrobacter]MDQ0662619.1 hypothetical protein [Arthrobacter ulcerisalmonis]MDQ0730511.1 hypothetical protein [Arthrobacter sp. B1I2]
MTENPEVAAEEPRKGSSAPGLEGEGGQYVDGDYGDAGAVERPAGELDDQYPEGDYGAAGTAGSPAGSVEDGGQYVDGDYGDAGAINEPERALADGEYEEGDYGDAGTAGGRTEEAIREGLTDRQVQTTAEERGPLHGDRDTER